ncbi:MAG: NAD(P)H-dependent oxidoreductase [Candidatus Pacebacteria bacterium]|jgi:NAD(P)H-dependent FMN reductase|nr:NAD(P)H-dependent oxidoreductase [Candidatus Paceibacterota bacterium]
MKITIISSSMRRESQTNKIGKTIKVLLDRKAISENIPLESVHVDLVSYGLPFFDDTIEDTPELQSLWKPLSEHLATSDGFVFITPEWNGTASPMLKNFFMYVDTELAHKPALLVSTTANATNGAYPIAELRSGSYKNTHIIYIPHHVIVRNVNTVCNSDIPNQESKEDVSIHGKITHSLDELITYATYLSQMRAEKPFDLEKFPYGM